MNFIELKDKQDKLILINADAIQAAFIAANDRVNIVITGRDKAIEIEESLDELKAAMAHSKP